MVINLIKHTITTRLLVLNFKLPIGHLCLIITTQYIPTHLFENVNMQLCLFVCPRHFVILFLGLAALYPLWTILLLRAGFYCIVIIYRQSRKTQDGGVCGAADGGDDPRGRT